MKLARYNPVNPMSFIEDFFNRNIADYVGTDFAVNHPSVNIVEENDRFMIELAAPGLAKDDFKVKIEKDHLIISSEKEVENEETEEGKYTRREFNYTSFSRSFYIPKEVNRNEISANYDNGILTVTLLKKEEAKEIGPVDIEIK